MKHRLLPLILLFVLPMISYGQDFTIIETDSHHIRLRFEFNEFSFDTVRCNGELMQTIATRGIVAPNEYGMPDLPTFNRFIAIPQGAKATVEVRTTRSERMTSVNIAPSLGAQCENETDRPYHKDAKCYSTDALYPTAAYVVANPQQLRGVDVIHLGISPVQFNPVRQELAINHQLDIDIRFEGGNGHYGDDRLRSPYWDPILQNNILNYDCLAPIDYDARRQEWVRNRATGCEYLIITPNNDAFINAAQELANYRTRQGILTDVISLEEVGVADSRMLRTWIREIYQNWDIPPAAVCLIGEGGDNIDVCVPAFRVQHPIDNSVASDNPYADIDGDNLPDITFSRLVAETEEELPIFIGKQIEYEYTNPCMDQYFYEHPLTASAWQTNKWFQITISTIYGYLSQHGKTPTRLSEIHSGELSDQWSSASGTSNVVSYFGPDGLGYIPATPGELGGWTGATAEHVIRAFNQGAYIVQHRDHGWNQKWYQPLIYVSDFGAINNPGHMPFLISINCRTGQYDVPTLSFTEALMRMTRDGQNAGIVGAISPTGQTYSFANDIFLWGIWDLFDPSFLPNYGPYANHIAEWLPSFALVSGKYFLREQVFPGTDETMLTTIFNTYHAHCDAFLRIFTDVPQTIEATFDESITRFIPFHVTAPEGVQIALSARYGRKDHLIATAIGTGEEQTLYLTDFVPTNTLTLTMTGLNRLRREETITVTPIEGPYVIADSVAINNGAESLPYGQSGTINLTLKNFGIQSNEAGTAKLSNSSGQMLITQDEASFPVLSPDESLNIENAFRFSLTDDIPDYTKVPFTITTQYGGVSLEREFEMTVTAPRMTATLTSIEDENSNGDLDPGEYATLTFRVTNIGHYQAVSPRFALHNNEGYIHVITPEKTIDNMPIGASIEVSFEIYIEYSAGEVPTVDLLLTTTVNNLVMENHITHPIGFSTESFESGVFNPQYWTNDPEHPWTIEHSGAYDGEYCAMSDTTITHDESSWIKFTYTSSDPGTFSFFSRLSSETNFDFLIFYIDDVEKGKWSGTQSWFSHSYNVGPGSHEYKWLYSKDYSVNAGEDCAWIDYISLPPYLDETTEQDIHPLDLYPNPTTDEIRIGMEQEGHFTVQVFDESGRLILSEQDAMVISFKNRPAGLYHIVVMQDGRRWSRRIVKM